MASEWVAYIFAKMTDGITIELASRCDIGRWMELAEKTGKSTISLLLAIAAGKHGDRRRIH